MSQHSQSREAYLNLEHARRTGNIPSELPLSRRTSSRRSQEVIIIPASELPTQKPEATSKPVEYWQWDEKLVRVTSDSYEPNRLGSQS